MVKDHSESENVRALAARVGCLTEEEVIELSGYSPGSMETMRAKGKVPPYTQFGARRLYPVTRAAEWIASRVRERVSVPAGDLL